MFLKFSIFFLCFHLSTGLTILPTKQVGIGIPCSSTFTGWISATMREEAVNAKLSPLPVFNDTIYLAGVYNRVQSDAMITSLHKPLRSLVLCECVDYKGEYLQTIEDYLNNIVRARSWSSVAHDQSFDYFYGRAYWIELFSIGIATVLLQTLYMLENKISSSTKNNVLNAIETRIIKPMDKHFAGDPDILRRHSWKDAANNWNIVCWSGVARVALLAISDQQKRDMYVLEAFTGSQYSWGSWKSDGYNHEGAAYYNYPVVEMIMMRQHVMEASNGKNDYFSIHPNTDSMLGFAFEYPMSGEKTAFFADDGVGLINPGIRQYLEFIYSPNPTVGAIDISISWDFSGNALRWSLWQVAKNRFKAEKTRIFETGIRKYYENSGVLICRPIEPNGMAASFKLLGGSEESSGGHNHDDAGTYSVMLNGVNVVGDIGCGSYEVTWSRRYDESEIWNSYSHPLPIIGGKLQTRNMNYYYYKNATLPKVIATSFTDEEDTISFDLKSLYPVVSLSSLIRTNTFIRTPGSQSVVIQDKVKFSSSTTYEFAIPSRNGIWTEISATSNTLNGVMTVDTTSLNVRIHANNQFKYSVARKTVLGLTYTRVGVSFLNPILDDTITVTFN